LSVTPSTNARWPHIRHILIDADDTLWENNIYFEQATEAFVDFLDHSTLSRTDVKAVLDEFERVNARQHGYGSAVYTRSLQDCFRHLAERDIDDSALEVVMQIGRRILQQELELIPHVETTLAKLSRDYVLTMCTKGDPDEQQIKVDRSGLVHYFHQIEIMPEKDRDTYSDILGRLGARPEEACMVGNSPKSDVNPPLELGMAAVFIPHDHTWQLEYQEVDRSHERLLVLDRFVELIDHF
jgi:putative hydrolase of the HAD superfamily